MPLKMRVQRPTTRSDCGSGGINAQRPCPWVGCKWNLWIETSHGGSGSDRSAPHLPKTDPTTLRYSCALDVAESHDDTMTLEEVGKVLRKTRERVRQIEETGAKKVRGQQGAKDALDLVTMLGSYEPVAPAPYPLLTAAERKTVRRLRPEGRPKVLCKRTGCARSARRSPGFKPRAGLAGYCSWACAHLDGVVHARN